MKKKLRATTATYTFPNGENYCDLVELATKYLAWGNVPKHVGDAKAVEISLLAEKYLEQRKILLEKGLIKDEEVE